MNRGLAEVGSAARELGRLLGDAAPDSDAATQLSRVDRGLRKLQRLMPEYESRMEEVRQRTEQLRSRTFAWITPVAVLLSAVCFWIAVSQVSLLVHAWGWWTGRGCNH